MIPTLGVAGKFKVSTPFSIDDTKSYKCRSVSFIQSLVDKGVDVFNDFYAPAGLTQADFDNDTASEIAIVTLKTSDGDIANIPSRYIEEAPIDLEVPYNRFAVMLDIGLLPSDTSFSFLIDQLSEISKAATGVEANASLATLTYDGFVTKEEHHDLIQEREVNIRYDNSTITALRKALEREQSLKQRVEALEELVIRLSNP